LADKTEIKNSVFNTLNDVDVSEKIKTKGKLSYLSWSSAWAEVKKRYPLATYRIVPQIMDELGNTRFWHTDGKTGWVEVEVTIEDESISEVLAIMDFKNQSIVADDITSVDANKSLKRCLTKACAMHGLGLHIYNGEDLPENIIRAEELKEEIEILVGKKVKLSDAAKKKVGELCRKAEQEAFPELPDEAIIGQYKYIADVDILEKLKRQLIAVRK
jgi:hypothetical protein